MSTMVKFARRRRNPLLTARFLIPCCIFCGILVIYCWPSSSAHAAVQHTAYDDDEMPWDAPADPAQAALEEGAGDNAAGGGEMEKVASEEEGGEDDEPVAGEEGGDSSSEENNGAAADDGDRADGEEAEGMAAAADGGDQQAAGTPVGGEAEASQQEPAADEGSGSSGGDSDSQEGTPEDAPSQELHPASVAASGGGGSSTASSSTASSSTASSSSSSREEGLAEPAQEVCTDKCASAGDGVCDEGRPGAGTPPVPVGDRDPTVYAIKCDLGTDCADCGPWKYRGAREALAWQPIQDILAKGFKVNVRQTDTPSPYWMAFTDPEQDLDVSRQMQDSALVEGPFSALWYRILKEGCIGPGGEPRVVLDVGANFGYYTLLAASMGCRVIAWEPVPYFASFLQYGLLRNNLTERVQLRRAVVGAEAGKTLTIVVPKRGIWGTAGVDGMNIDGAIDNQGEYDKVERPAERLDEVVQEDVLLMKVDVEGYEPLVLQSAARLLLKHKVDNLIMEYSPGVAERHFNWELYVDNPKAMARLINRGYTIMHLAGLGMESGWEGPLPRLEVLTGDVLKNDIEDGYRLANRTLGCPLPPEVEKKLGCNWIPEGLHPHSFHAVFGHNTNLWAVREGSPSHALAKPGRPAALFPLEYDLKGWSTVNAWGMARRICKDVKPEDQVLNRCRCTDLGVCGELEALVVRLAGEGNMPPQNSEPYPWPANVEQLRVEDWLPEPPEQ